MENRVAVLFHRLGPYHFARLRAAAEALQNVLAIEFSGVDHTYAWEKIEGADRFQRVTLFPQADSKTQPLPEIHRRMRAALEEYQPTVVVIPGWADVESLVALQWCLTHGIHAVVMSETTAWDETRKWWKEWLKHRVVKLYSSGFVGGQAHRDYLIKLGLRFERIFLGYDVVDNDYFAVGATKVRNQDTQIRQQFQLPPHYFLASARFIQKKNLPGLLQAYAKYFQAAQKSGDRNQIWSLVLLGDGPLRADLQAQLLELKLDDHVKMPGFKQYEELPIYYGLASAFIHISTVEPWGLVVNEAMASALPVLVSDRCGCVDLVEEEINGFIVNPYRVEEIASKMLQLTTPSVELSKWGDASRRMISKWSPLRFAEGLKEAIDSALSAPLPRLGWLDRTILWLLIHR